MVVSDFKMDPELQKMQQDRGGQALYPTQNYKDEIYRRGIAQRYRIGLVLNSRGYWEPRLQEDMPTSPPPKQEVPSLFQIMNQ